MSDAPSIPPAHAALCAAFAGQFSDAVPWTDPERATARCALVSALFAVFAQQHGHAAELWYLEGAPAVFVPERRPASDVADFDVVHCVVQLDGFVVVDWTARQFNPALPCPVVEVRRDPWPEFWTPHARLARPALLSAA